MLQYSQTVTSNSAELTAQIERGCTANLRAAALIWHGGVVRELTGNRSGRQYSVPGTHRFYVASAPGEAPASRTGDLRTSYQFRVYEEEAEAIVGSPLEYAVHLELGTRNMAPRPHLYPAYEKNRAAIQSALSREVI